MFRKVIGSVLGKKFELPRFDIKMVLRVIAALGGHDG